MGNSDAEYGVRGYLTAYDPETGDQKWRWFVVPGDPSKPFEDKSMGEAAAKTWDPKWQILDQRRRRYAVGYDDVRSRIEPPLYRHRQWARRGTRRTSAAQRAAAKTISILPRSSRSTRIQENMSGIIRRRPAYNWDYYVDENRDTRRHSPRRKDRKSSFMRPRTASSSSSIVPMANSCRRRTSSM